MLRCVRVMAKDGKGSETVKGGMRCYEMNMRVSDLLCEIREGEG